MFGLYKYIIQLGIIMEAESKIIKSLGLSNNYDINMHFFLTRRSRRTRFSAKVLLPTITLVPNPMTK